MIDTPNAGAACKLCKMLGHYCRATVVVNDVPLCDTCLKEEPCAAAIAHRIRITGLGGDEAGTFSGPVKQIKLSKGERKPFKEVETKTAWRAEFERRSAEDKKKANKPRPSVEILEARRLERNARLAAAKRSKYVPSVSRFCSCGNGMRSNNKNSQCWRCTDKIRQEREREPKPQCAHVGCLELINRNMCKFCWWHNPRNRRESPYRAARPKMQSEAA